MNKHRKELGGTCEVCVLYVRKDRVNWYLWEEHYIFRRVFDR